MIRQPHRHLDKRRRHLTVNHVRLITVSESNSRAVHKHSLQTRRQFATNFSDLKEQAEAILTLETHLVDRVDLYLPIVVGMGTVGLSLVVTMVDHKEGRRSSSNEKHGQLPEVNHYPPDRGHKLASYGGAIDLTRETIHIIKNMTCLKSAWPSIQMWHLPFS